MFDIDASRQRAEASDGVAQSRDRREGDHGRYLAFRHGTRESNVWLVEDF